MKFPDKFLESIQNAPGFDKEAFEDIHASGEQVTSVRINPSKQPQADLFPGRQHIPWTSYGHYLPERPSFTFDPFFHAGCYYVQEASSMFLEQAVKTADLSSHPKVLDLCAAPGGKSTHLQSLLTQESLLVSNEVIRARGNILRDNMVKWGGANVVVSHNDPAHFTALADWFDLIVIDAPCSGSGLFRRDPGAMEEWSTGNVQLCSQRQQRILADTWPSLKPGGMLVYATCSYSVQEDEDIANWIINSLGATFIPLTVPEEWGIVTTEAGYRFWPYRLKGEGFFMACFRKPGDNDEAPNPRTKRINAVSKKENELVSSWIDGDFSFIRNNELVYAWPAAQVGAFSYLLDNLRVSYAGTLVGEFAREKIIPAHALAMSRHVAPGISRLELDRENAIRYLQRKEISTQGSQKGWQLAAYEGMPLGWVNVLPNRINNYYPKELRILKDF